ncbi:hypothetical protein CKM354_001119000 [Cercospora kikuchii]|uniref:Uncharacterized protein n=1 Tax=Cercospora kikuchii TaxID=84275 RepID=A0A9P3CRT9_9PEZI|nr:uncharacterized protein CKM354_001119000 [Cercospora kikuchii]GIZ48117.1 hypothetical protein CKM354_001119000 [Cercospora kikuchii]
MLGHRLFGLFLLAATPAFASLDDILSRIRALEENLRDTVHVGNDGVVRAFDAKGIVINYFSLANDELMELESDRPEEQRLWTTVNGHDVAEEHCRDPPEYILPAKYWYQGMPSILRRNTDPALLKRLQLCSREYCDDNNPCKGTPAAQQLCPCQGGNYKTCGTA